MLNNPLLNQDFLKKLDKASNREIYAEIFLLDNESNILETIEGRVTQGSVNVDGASSVRRTCTLTIVANELNIHEYYWGLNSKFKLSIGLKNNIDNKYPEIIWFKQGEFAISSFSTNQALSTYTINIQGRDKMTLLNGEFGGIITSLTWDFGMVSEEDDIGTITEKKLLIKDIIIGAVHQFANEPLYKIIVNDLEDKGLELLEYKSQEPLYAIIDERTQEYHNITLNGDTIYYSPELNKNISLKEIPIYNPLFDLEKQGIVNEYSIITPSEGERIPLSVAKLTYGMTAGYRLTDLVYPQDLILNVGQPVTALLDTIVDMLGDFEYFYDIDGNFIFQRKKTYINVPWNNMINNLDEQYVENSAFTSSISYSFEDGTQISSYTNNPDFANLRNDFSVWGERSSASGGIIPIHMRFAIDKKPFLFVNYEGQHFTSLNEEGFNHFLWGIDSLDSKTENILYECEWREIIYQMAIDYNKHHLDEDYYVVLNKNNYGLYSNGKTGYEQYYVDLEGFWRSIYDPEGATRQEYQQIYLTKEEYQKTPEIYYWQGYNNSNIINCIIDEPYQGIDYNYYKNGLKINITEEEYLNNIEEYSYVKEIEYSPCALIEVYSQTQSYYNKVANSQEYVLVPKLTREEYYNNPSLYYYRQYDYIPCEKDSKYDETITYYKKAFNRTTDTEYYASIKNISETIFNADPSLYYIRSGEPRYVNCLSRLQEFNNLNQYVIKLEDNKYLPIAISNESEYNREIITGTLYTQSAVLENCRHPVEYNNVKYFYKIGENKYNEQGWLKDVYTSPETLNFWFDFLDEDSELQKYGSYAIGNRPKAINDNKIKAIYFRETPTVIFIEPDKWDNIDYSKLGYTYLQLPNNMSSLFTISGQGKSAKSAIDELLYANACLAEKITISILPIYHLVPNTRIFINNDKNGINGEYIITNYNISLGNTNSMSIQASKAVDRLY